MYFKIKMYFLKCIYENVYYLLYFENESIFDFYLCYFIDCFLFEFILEYCFYNNFIKIFFNFNFLIKDYIF